ncbi:MAG: PilZ domain-containing protein [Candidatus Omnitrophica bacterium]|nr:PilZ domain-containing protein [Candidatus Omnitrophota bacterium]
MQTSLRTIPETEGFRKQERRRYPRVHYVWPIRFRELNGRPTPLLHAAQSKNLSQSGMKITSIVPLQRNAITLLELNLKSLAVIVPADDILMIDERHILVEVVWRRLNLESRLFETGLRFLERKRRCDYEALISRAKYFSSPLVGEGVIHHTNSGTTFRGKSL